jgi:hypothetical protein
MLPHDGLNFTVKYNKNQLLLNTFIGHKPNAFRPTCWPSSVVKILIHLYMVQQNFFTITNI